jgi:hypothetical protein
MLLIFCRPHHDCQTPQNTTTKIHSSTKTMTRFTVVVRSWVSVAMVAFGGATASSLLLQQRHLQDTSIGTLIANDPDLTQLAGALAGLSEGSSLAVTLATTTDGGLTAYLCT